jgi:D-amino-acid dehydrogenase
MRAYVPLNQRALAAFDELTGGGVDARTSSADPFLACFRTTEERAPLLQEIRRIENAGQEVKFDVLTGDEARAAEPALSSAIESAVKLYDQRFIDPPAFLAALADSILERGGRIVEDTSVTGVDDDVAGRVVIRSQPQRDDDTFDSVVLANGAWLGDLARRFGVRQPLQAGRGYSFSVDGAQLPRAPVYFPAQRVACTPLSTAGGPRLRVAGMMEFRPPDAALDRRRVAAIVEATRPLLEGVDFEDRHDEWVGSRPCTADGLPLIGATSSPRVFVAGGHGMWGIALGPLTGKLLALQMATGTATPALKPFIPTRRPGRIGDPRW